MLLVAQIVNDPLYIPDHIEPDLADLLTGLLCKGVTLSPHQVYYLIALHGQINCNSTGFL